MKYWFIMLFAVVSFGQRNHKGWGQGQPQRVAPTETFTNPLF